MAARPQSPAPLTPPAELEQMVRRAGLSLNAGQMADLALAWRQVSELVERLPRAWRLADDQAYVFRLSPPAAAAGAPARQAAVAKAAGKTAARPAAPARRKPARKMSGVPARR